ncbi:MAG: hypothetical protein ACYDB2_03655 [Acidimicrobiales bacterium]
MVRRTQHVSRSRSEDDGTLNDVLMALLVLGLAGVALVGAFTIVIGASSEHRTWSTTDVVLRDFVESATYQIQQQPTPPSLPCATSSGTATESSSGISYSNAVNSDTVTFAPPRPTGYSIQVQTGTTQCLYNNTALQASDGGGHQYWPPLITAVATWPKGSPSLSFVIADPKGTERHVHSTPPTTTTTKVPLTTTSTKIHVRAMSGRRGGTIESAGDALVTTTVDEASGSPVTGVVVGGS